MKLPINIQDSMLSHISNCKCLVQLLYGFFLDRNQILFVKRHCPSYKFVPKLLYSRKMLLFAILASKFRLLKVPMLCYILTHLGLMFKFSHANCILDCVIVKMYSILFDKKISGTLCPGVKENMFSLYWSWLFMMPYKMPFVLWRADFCCLMIWRKMVLLCSKKIFIVDWHGNWHTVFSDMI